MAVKEFLDKLKSNEIFDTLNEVYLEPESLEETALREKSKAYCSKKILKQGQWINQISSKKWAPYPLLESEKS